MLFALRKKICLLVMAWRRVLIVSYPKSGRTWLRVMLNEIGVFPQFSHASGRYDIATSDGERKDAEDINVKRCKRVLLIIRDPRDTIVSSYYQAKKQEGKEETKTKGFYQGDLSSFIRDENIGFRSVINFNINWLNQRNLYQEFMIVSYEDMRSNTAELLKKIVSFLIRPLSVKVFFSSREIAETVASNEFERMKQKEISGELQKKYGDRFSAGDKPDEANLKVRKGQVSGYLSEMSEDDISYCNQIMIETDYDKITKQALSA